MGRAQGAVSALTVRTRRQVLCASILRGERLRTTAWSAIHFNLEDVMEFARAVLLESGGS